MSLEIDVNHHLGRIDLEVTFSADAGLTALVGPSGAGKTSLLNIVAGLVRPDRGLVRHNGETWVDTSRGFHRPAHLRRIGYVFQEPRLFPHLSVRHNLGYGRWIARGRPSRIHFDDVVDVLGLRALLARRPAMLSGGEAQRVALGRALLAQPSVLLFDEPLASVDAARREEVLPYLDRVRAALGIPMIYVTHTLKEVQSRAGLIITLEEGRIVRP